MAGRCIFAPQIVIFNFLDIMDNIQNTGGKGYCMLYLAMGLFFFISLLLMLYNRNFILDFVR